MIHWKPEGRKKTRPFPENLERWNIYRHEWTRSKNGRMEQSKAMEYKSRKASSDVLKSRYIYGKAIFIQVSFSSYDKRYFIYYFAIRFK
jgi:hypothetical protein